MTTFDRSSINSLRIFKLRPSFNIFLTLTTRLVKVFANTVLSSKNPSKLTTSGSESTTPARTIARELLFDRNYSSPTFS